MANLSQTLKTQTVNCLGLQQSTKWGQANGVPYTMTWGTSQWGVVNLQVNYVRKVLGAQNLASTFGRTSLGYKKYISQSLPVSSRNSSEKLSSGPWTYVFPSDATDGEGRSFASWTSVGPGVDSFVCGSTSTTPWT